MPVLTSSIVSVPLVVRFTTVTQSWFALHHAEGWAGMSPPPFQLPPRHQAPVAEALARVVGVVEVGPAEEQVAELVAQTPILQSSGTVR